MLRAILGLAYVFQSVPSYYCRAELPVWVSFSSQEMLQFIARNFINLSEQNTVLVAHRLLFCRLRIVRSTYYDLPTFHSGIPVHVAITIVHRKLNILMEVIDVRQ